MPGGTINTGSHPKALWPGVHAWWGQTYAQHEVEYTDLYEVEDSGGAYEEDVMLTGFGLALRKAEGGGVFYDSEAQGPTQRYTHIAYGLGYKVTYEELRDNLYSAIAMRRSQANAFSMAQTIENIAAAPYNDAFTGNVFTFADGLSMINAAHVNATGGTFSNALSPAAPLSETSLEDMSVLTMGAQNDRGLLINVMPRTLHVSRQQWYNANRIMKTVQQVDSANNTLNLIKAMNVYPGGIKLNHYFTSANAWYVRTNIPNGMRMFWRDRPSFDQDNDFDTKNAKAASYMRFSVGATDPRGIYGSNAP